MTIKYLDSKRIQALSGETYYQEADGNSGASMSNGGTYYAYGTEIRAGHSSITKKADKWTIRFGRNNSPQGVVEAHIYTGTEGATSKTHSQTSTNSITVDALSTSDADYSFTFATPHTISAGDVFAIVWKTDTSTSGSNYVNIKLFNALTDMPNTRNYMVSTANWDGSDDDGHTWSVAPSPYTTYTLTSKLELIAEKTLITNVQDNSILVEKDTGKRYWFSEASDGADNITWSTTGKVGFNISGTTISRTGSSGWGTGKIQSEDTFTVGNGTFMIEFSGNNGSTMLGFNKGTLGYYIGSPENKNDFSIYLAGGSTVEVYESGSKNYDSGGSRNANDKFRIEIDNAGLVKYYLQAGGTGSWVLKYTSSTTASGTYFIQVNAYANTSESTVHSKYLATPATWTMEPTYETDFSTNKGWTNLTSDTSVTTKLNYTETNSTYIRATKDLQDSNALGSGNNMSDNFVIRFELNKTNDATNTANGTQPLIGISSATTDGWFNNQDSIGMILSQDTNQTHSIRAVGADNQYTHQGDSADAAYTWTTGIRYCEVIKNATADTVTATIYTNSDYTGSLGTASVSTSGKTFSGLRYLSMRNFADNGRSSTVWEMNNIQVYNGVTSIN